MPYIKREDREKEVDLVESSYYGNREDGYAATLDMVIDALIHHIQIEGVEYQNDDYVDRRKGLCNYIISRIVAGGMKPSVWSYTSLSEARAVFTDAGEEFARRMLGPYEDNAKENNGDVPEYVVTKKPEKTMINELDKPADLEYFSLNEIISMYSVDGVMPDCEIMPKCKARCDSYFFKNGKLCKRVAFKHNCIEVKFDDYAVVADKWIVPFT